MRINYTEKNQLPDNLRYLSTQDEPTIFAKKDYQFEGYTKKAVSTCERVVLTIFSIVLPFLLLSKDLRRQIFKGKEIIYHFSRLPGVETIKEVAEKKFKIVWKPSTYLEILGDKPLDEIFAEARSNFFNYKLEKLSLRQDFDKKDARHLLGLLKEVPTKQGSLFLYGLLSNPQIINNDIEEKFIVFCLKLINRTCKESERNGVISSKKFILYSTICFHLQNLNKLDGFFKKCEDKIKDSSRIIKPHYAEFIYVCQEIKKRKKEKEN